MTDDPANLSTEALIIKTAFKLHEEKLLPKKDLVDILENLVNATALDNGYAEKYGLPFPGRSRRRRGRRVP